MSDSSLQSDDGEPLLTVRNLKKHFDTSTGLTDRLLGGGQSVKAVDGVDLTLHEGETLAVVGESGCGKSTLGRAILNLHQPTDGTVRYGGEDITHLSGKEMKPYRQKLQLIFQDPLSSLNPRQTVNEIISAPMEVHGIGDSAADRRERVEELLVQVGLKESHADRYPHQFSGGQQQRVGIARALALEPRVIVADEPVSALDVSVQAQILNLLSELQSSYGLSLLTITHDLSVVSQIADRVAVMYLGEIVEIGPVEQIFERPQHPYTRALLSAVPRIDAADRTDRILLKGSVPSPINPPSGCRFHTRCPEVIPSSAWPGNQSTFREAFRFYNRLLHEELEIDLVRERLENEGRSTDTDTVATQLLDESFQMPIEELPDDVQTVMYEIARHLIEDNREQAIETAQGVLDSPCKQSKPEMQVSGASQASCHLLTAEVTPTISPE
ncbi:ABC transporter ATP-binding protein [Halalkalirubrum salinum]|uniref:ABC transporter ATP-binding protein n=1 Tax=Halalkalirubrum salinum TaxID=2563889 RepID=UPI0010FB86CE|nr:oligopeptide/dipeptide ABC transporter ATP-binding protein [Halalkalirubrum salinum]